MLTIQTRNTRRLIGVASLLAGAAFLLARPYISTSVAWTLFVACFALFALWIPAYWRSIGEVARDGQKTAWLWGGAIGMGVAIGLVGIPAVFPLIDAIIAWVATSPGVVNPSFVAGVLWVFAAQLIGFALYWLGWWIAKR